MVSTFLQDFGACRLDRYNPPPQMEEDADESAPDEHVDLNYEVPADRWRPLDTTLPSGWDPDSWPERPTRFIDGKDVGETVAWVRAPGGYPVPIRLAQIGSVVMEVADRVCRRAFYVAEPVVSLVTQPFPWDAIEAFALDLQACGLRLLPAVPPDGQCSYDFEKMRKAAQNRSMTEMTVLEQAMLARSSMAPTVVDGRLEPRRRGFDPSTSAVYGVIKTHWKQYLHGPGMQVLYALEHGQRTPLFRLDEHNLSVVTWYVRLGEASLSMPNYGLIRVEVPAAWFEARGRGEDFVRRLTHLLCLYRCRSNSYARAAISLHPIVRAEESLGACFRDGSRLTSHFCNVFKL